MTQVSICRVAASEQAEAADTIERQLLQSLACKNTQSENAHIVLEARTSRGALAGGVVGAISYGWLLTKVLWVDAEHQRSGIGQKLMAEIETRARELGCHNAWLDTSDTDARAFYMRLGYEEFGMLANAPGEHPSGHQRWFMKKAL